MKLRSFLAVPAMFTIILVSCGKEKSYSSYTDPGLSGNWNLISVTGTTTVTDSYKDAATEYKGYTSYRFVSTLASGFYKITPSEFNGNNITYETDGTLIEKIDIDGTTLIDDTVDMPAIVPLTTSTSTYKQIGTDSLYFTSGSSLSVTSGSASNMKPVGCKFKIDGNTLTIYMNDSQKSIISQNGLNINRVMGSSAIMILKK